MNVSSNAAPMTMLNDSELAAVSGGAQMDGGLTAAQMDGKNG